MCMCVDMCGCVCVWMCICVYVCGYVWMCVCDRCTSYNTLSTYGYTHNATPTYTPTQRPLLALSMLMYDRVPAHILLVESHDLIISDHFSHY